MKEEVKLSRNSGIDPLHKINARRFDETAAALINANCGSVRDDRNI